MVCSFLLLFIFLRLINILPFHNKLFRKCAVDNWKMATVFHFPFIFFYFSFYFTSSSFSVLHFDYSHFVVVGAAVFFIFNFHLRQHKLNANKTYHKKKNKWQSNLFLVFSTYITNRFLVRLNEAFQDLAIYIFAYFHSIFYFCI